MIYCCARRLWSQICVTCRTCWFPDSIAPSSCAGTRRLWPEGWLHSYEMVTEHLANTNLSMVAVAISWLSTGLCQTHARGGTLDLLMTDVHDLVRVAVVAPIGNSDHSSLSAVISMVKAVPNLCVSRKVFLTHQVNWNTVCGAMQDLPWRNI